MKDSVPADFETAIKASGFGRFNILLLLVAYPGIMATVLETGVVSYILPSAECDLDLNLMDKGILNAISYCGMIVSAFAWGYLADTRGRKNIQIWGFLINVVCILCAAMSQNVVQLMLAKFFGGLIICGPFSVLVSYLVEFHGNKFRPRIMMIVGVMATIASILLPVLALLILPNAWDFTIWNLHFNAWKVYLAICGIPSLMGGILLILFPETPRFLMSQQRNAEALEVFKTIYAINTRKPKETYPILELLNDSIPHKDIKYQDIPTTMKCVDLENNSDLNSAKQPSPLKTLFSKTYIILSLRVYLLNFFILLGQNTMRLWLPQLFASINEYQEMSAETTSMCSILEYSVNKTDIIKSPEVNCVVVITPSTYSNNIIVAAIVLVGFFVAGALINILGDKRIQIIVLTISGTCGLTLYWSSSTLTTLVITSLYSSMSSIAATSSIGTSVSLFPTSTRTMIVSLTMTFGRLGTILGNVLFPIFMSFGCIPPMIMIGSVMYLACFLAASLPSSKKLDLK